MAKYNPVTGKRIGKVGGEVYSVVRGEAIVREKPIVVSNPNTEAQVEVRAKLKLMSQLSAVLGPVIAIPREGIKSPRNLFVKANYGLTSYANSEADINLNGVQLTKSAVGLSGFTADRSNGQSIHVVMDENLAGDFDRVVYIAAMKLADGTLRLLDSAVVTTPGTDGNFPAELEYTANAVVVYAYGMRDNSDSSRATFGNMLAPSAETVAKIIVSRSLTLADVTMTETRGLTMLVGEDTGSSESFERATITLTSTGSGTVSGAGLAIIGQSHTVRAQAASGAEFVNWRKDNASGEILSTNPNYSFTVTENVTLHATFTTAPAVIAVSADPTEGGTVSGGNTYQYGATVNLNAVANNGYRFLGWYEGETLVSANAAYSFTASISRSLVAKFRLIQTYVVTPQSADSTKGSVSGGGNITEGNSATVVATANTGYAFVNWRKGSASGQIVSTSATYTFTPTESVTLVATFEEVSGIPVVTSGAATGITINGTSYSNGDTYTGPTGTAVTFRILPNGMSTYNLSYRKNGQYNNLSYDQTGTVTIPADADQLDVNANAGD